MQILLSQGVRIAIVLGSRLDSSQRGSFIFFFLHGSVFPQFASVALCIVFCWWSSNFLQNNLQALLKMKLVRRDNFQRSLDLHYRRPQQK